MVTRGYGNGRMIGFVADGGDMDATVVANLDYPGVTVEVDNLNFYSSRDVSDY
jgi:hypothetical protein